MAERLTPGILDLEVWGSSVVSLDKELCSTLSLFTQRYNWVHTTGGGGVTLRLTGIPFRGSSNTPSHFSC